MVSFGANQQIRKSLGPTQNHQVDFSQPSLITSNLPPTTMTALSNLLNKDKAVHEEELDIASLAPTVATADSVKQKKKGTRGSKKGGKKNGDSSSSLGDLFEKFGESAGSLGSDPEEMTMCTADSREQSSSSLRKSKRGRKKDRHNQSRD